MSSFLEIATPLAEHGFRVFPLIPKQKRPVRMEGEYDHFDVASTDLEQLRVWSTQEPNANVGLSPDEIFCFLETDDEQALKEACADLSPEVWDTTRVSARDNRCYYIFRQTMRTKAAGNMTVKREGQENLYEFKQCRMYVTGPGSIHPKTGTPYNVVWQPIPALPDVLLNRLRELYGAPKATTAGVMKPEVQTQTELLDRFLAHYEVAFTGDWFNKGKQWFRPVECPWASVHDNESGASSTCVIYTEGGGYGFNCKHRCEGKGWQEFRGELESRNPGSHFAFSEPGPPVTFGTQHAEPDPGEFEEAQETTRPSYPDHVWKDTFYGEFADYCSAGNYIPKRFFSESIRTVIGAVVGNQLSSDKQGVSPRMYTILIGGPGSGKGTAVTAAEDFLLCEFDSRTRTGDRPLLWKDSHDSDNWCWQARMIGAHVISPASAPGLIQSTNPHKLAKGEVRNVMELWRGLPRFITIQEEIRGLFANFANENSGSALQAALLELYEHDGFTTTATNERSAKSGGLLYSFLGGIPKTEWDIIFARSSSVGSGFFTRLNILGTENEKKVGELPKYAFDEMRRRFLPRVSALESTPQHIPLSLDGKTLLNEWFPRVSAELADAGVPSGRLNIHAMRTGLHLAWLRGHATISEEDMDAGIKVANFQAKMREFYMPAEGDNPDAQLQARMRQVMNLKKSMSYRNFYRDCHGDRAGTTAWDRAFNGLVKSRVLAVVNERGKNGRGVKTVKLLKIND